MTLCLAVCNTQFLQYMDIQLIDPPMKSQLANTAQGYINMLGGLKCKGYA